MSSGTRVRTPGKYIVMSAAAFIVVAASMAGAWRSYDTRARPVEGLEYRPSADGRRTAFYEMPDILVDLSPDKNGRTAFLKLSVSINIDDDATTLGSALEAKAPMLNERLTFFLRELRPEDFAGSAAMRRVKTEMLRRVNTVLDPLAADDVVIEEMIIQ